METLEQALFVAVTLDACEHLVAVRPREEVHLKQECKNDISCNVTYRRGRVEDTLKRETYEVNELTRTGRLTRYMRE